MARDTYIYGGKALIGGDTGALDAISLNDLQDDDTAIVLVPEDKVYHYEFDSTATSDESSPTVIVPDDVGASAGRWKLLTSYSPHSITSTANHTGVNDFIDGPLSPMILSGGTISESATATQIKVATLTALLRTADEDLGPLEKVSVGITDNLSVVATNTTYHAVLQYNDESPQVVLQVENANGTTEIGIGKVLKNENDSIHYVNSGMRLFDGISKLHKRAAHLRSIELASGCAISHTATRNFKIATGGKLYEGINLLTPFVSEDFDTTKTATYVYNYVYHSGGTWTSTASQSVISNQDYDDGDNLASLGNNLYGCNWVYLHPDDEHVYVVAGYGSYTLAEAEIAKDPSDLPTYLADFGVLLGCIIVEEDGVDFQEIQMVTDRFFTGSGAADHGNLAGLTEDDHPQYVLHSIFDANSILKADADNVATILEVAEQTVVGRITGGTISDLTTASVKALCSYMTDLSDDTSPQLASDLDTNKHSVKFSYDLTADHTYNGHVVNVTLGATVAFPETLAYDISAKNWILSNAATLPTMPAMLMALEDKNVGSTCKCLRWGYVRDDSWSWTADDTVKVLYPKSVGGDMTTTAVGTTGYYSQAVGVIMGATRVEFCPNPILAKHA